MVDNELNFEESLKKLEEIIKKLEVGDVSLDDAINKFNEAMKLSKACDLKLKQAEQAISKLVKEDGSLENFEINED